MTEVYTPDIAEAFNAAGDRLRLRLQAVAEARDLPVCFTGLGSMMCSHIGRLPIERPDEVPTGTEISAARALIHLELIARGQYAARRGMLVLSLPMKEEQFDGLVAAYADILDAHRPLFERVPSDRLVHS